MMINYAHLSKNVTNLGPGNRNVLWVQGCKFNCEGCVAPEHKSDGGHWADTEKLALTLCEGDVEGVTISGGEPFDQSDSLLELLSVIRKTRDLGVIVFTGYTFENLSGMSDENDVIKQILEKIDLLVDGPYIKELDKGDKLRGSTNQRFFFMSQHYSSEEIETYNANEREMIIRQDNGDIMMIGIPSEKQLSFWRNIKKYINKFVKG